MPTGNVLLGLGLIVLGIIMGVQGLQFIWLQKRQERRPRTILLAYWDAVGGIDAIITGILLVIGTILFFVPGLVLLLAGYERFRETVRQSKAKGEIEEIQAQIKDQGTSWELLNNLGFNYCEIGELDQAEESLKHALRINPRAALAHVNLGNVYLDLRKPELALKEYQKAKVLEPDNVGVEDNIQLVLKSQKQMTDKALKHPIRINSTEAHEHIKLSNDYLDSGKPELALEEYQKAKVLEPDNAEIENNIQLIQLMLESQKQIRTRTFLGGIAIGALLGFIFFEQSLRSLVVTGIAGGISLGAGGEAIARGHANDGIGAGAFLGFIAGVVIILTIPLTIYSIIILFLSALIGLVLGGVGYTLGYTVQKFLK